MISELQKKIQDCGLTLEQYEACLADATAKVNRTTDIDWQEIVEKYNLNVHYDTLRKATQTIFGGAFVSEYYKEKHAAKSGNNSYLTEIREAKQAVRMEKQQLFDERTALNKKLREAARIQNDLSHLESLIKERAAIELPVHEQPIISSGNDLVACLSDFHYGADTDSSFGRYNSTIAAERLSEYIERIIEVQKTHNAENLYVLFLGDLINGEIHFTVQLESREMLVQQVQEAAELLSSFVYQLSSHFNNVYVNGVAGNHSRTSFKDQVLRGNRLDNLIPWYMKAKLQHIDNIFFMDSQNYDPTIGSLTIRGQEYWMVHGDWDSFNEAGVSKLIVMIGHRPAAIFYGHMHHNSYDEVAGGVQIIRSGCFSGSGDDHCVSKRIAGLPSQAVAVVDSNGAKCCYPIRFKRK